MAVTRHVRTAPRVATVGRKTLSPLHQTKDRLTKLLEEWLAEAKIRYTHPGD